MPKEGKAQHGLLLALSKADHTLAIVDPATLKVMAKVPVGQDPHEVAASSDGRTAYVSIYGGGSLHEINVIDLVAHKALFNLDTRPLLGPHGLAFVSGKLWFTAEGSKAVGSYDPATKKMNWCMGTGQDRTHMIYVTANAKRIYTTNVSSGTVSILVDTLVVPGPPPGAINPPDRQKRPGNMPPPPGFRPHETWQQTIIPTSRGSEGFDVTPDSAELWTASAEDGAISIIDLRSKRIAGKIDAKVFGANRVKFSPDGKLALISSLANGDLVIYDVALRKELKRIRIGHGAAGIMVQPDGAKAFVACTGDNYIAVIDMKKLEMSGHIDVGGGPDGLAWVEK
ncbi:MAG: YncE family protein [Bacteroidetes bacterium]|nr:YncE family protein [Bacteroidota bacterium]MBS1973708.1 YncE family protein [Bacteroidota bacterium]